MKRKLRIFSNIAIICLSVCMFAFGVYAASTVSVTTSGTVTFNASGVYADVIRNVAGAQGVSSTKQLKAEIRANATDNQKFSLNETNENLVFANVNEPIIMTFQIKNLATDRNLDFKIINSSDAGTNVEMEIFVSANMYDTTNNVYNVNPSGLDGDTETVKLVFRVINPNISASLGYNVEVNLSQQTTIASNVSVGANSTVERVGNTYLVSTNLYENSTNYQLTNYTYSTQTGYYEYVPQLSGTSVVSPIHIYDTTAKTITANRESVTNLLTFLNVSNGEIYIDQHNVTTAGTNLVIPMAVAKNGAVGLVPGVGTGLFNGNDKLKSVVIPITATSIGSSTFGGVSNLESITILSRNFEDNHFENCDPIYNCAKLTSIYINAGQYTSGANNNMLYNKITRELFVVGINTTDIPENTITISSEAFACNTASEIVLPNTVQYIKMNAMAGCSNLEYVTIGSRVKEIEYYVFFNCEKAITITFLGTKTQWIALDEASGGISNIKEVICIDGTLNFN